MYRETFLGRDADGSSCGPVFNLVHLNMELVDIQQFLVLGCHFGHLIGLVALWFHQQFVEDFRNSKGFGSDFLSFIALFDEDLDLGVGEDSVGVECELCIANLVGFFSKVALEGFGLVANLGDGFLAVLEGKQRFFEVCCGLRECDEVFLVLDFLEVGHLVKFE